MDIDELNRREQQIQDHAMRRIRSIKFEKQDARDARAAIAQVLIDRDNERGDMLRRFLKVRM